MKKAISVTSLFIVFVVNAAAILDKDIQEHIHADIAMAYSQGENKGLPGGGGGGGGDFLVVGSPIVIDPRRGSSCDYFTIQEAINDAKLNNIPEIRIATDRDYTENLVVDDMSIELIGGYSSCQLAGSPFSSPTDNQVLVYGGNVAPVLTITGSSQRNTVTLQNLRFLEGLGQAPNSDSAGGGILSYQANVRLALKNVDINSNDADYGGGIAIVGGDTDMSLQDSRVQNNLASYGGGIYCKGAGSSVVLLENSGIVANVANGLTVTGGGGGAYIDRCYFAMYSGSVSGGSVGISANYAFKYGGGIFAKNGANILIHGHKTCNANGCKGDEENPANISGNIAAGVGGGIYAIDEGTKIRIYAGLIANNTDGGYGSGGILIDEGQLIVGRLHKACWDAVRCNYFDGNVGGAIRAGNGSIVDISASYFENNIANYSSFQNIHGAVITSYHSTNNNDLNSIRIEGSVINNNGNDSTNNYIIYASGETNMSFIHTTIADNTVTSGNIYGSGAIFGVEETGVQVVPEILVRSSIIDNNGINLLRHDLLGHDLVVDFSCIITNEIASITASNNVINDAENHVGGAYIVSGFDPAFVDRNNRDYHLSSISAAIDYCYTPTYATVMYKDIDYEERNWDDYNMLNNYDFSYFDIGADESYVNDIIFKDGFD